MWKLSLLALGTGEISGFIEKNSQSNSLWDFDPESCQQFCV